MSKAANLKLAEEYIRFLAISSTKSGVQSFRWGLNRFIQWLGDKPVFSIEFADIISYLEQLTADGLKTGTRNQYLSALKGFWRFHESHGRTPFPATNFPKVLIRDRVSHPPVSKENFKEVMDALPPFSTLNIRDKCAFSMLYATGLRINELLSLDVTDLDLENQTATVKTEKRTNHTRPIYWDNMTHNNLLTWLDARRHILKEQGIGSSALLINLSTNHFGIRLDDACLQKSFRNLRVKLGLPHNLVIHSFRHGFATRADRKNVKILHISKMLGHAKIATTQIYLHTDDKEIEDSYRAAFGGDKTKPYEKEATETTADQGGNAGEDAPDTKNRPRQDSKSEGNETTGTRGQPVGRKDSRREHDKGGTYTTGEVRIQPPKNSYPPQEERPAK